jgi:hypothetical protein
MYELIKLITGYLSVGDAVEEYGMSLFFSKSALNHLKILDIYSRLSTAYQRALYRGSL